MKKTEKTFKTLAIILAIICGLLVVVIISSGVAVMQYKAQFPKVTMKQNVVINEGDTITLEDIADVTDNKKGYLLGAEWVNGSENGDTPNTLGLGPDDDSRHSVTVSEGKGQLKVYVTVWGKNHESVSGETIVTVK